MNDFTKNFPSPNNLSPKESHSNSYDNPPNKFRKIVKENDVSQASPIFIKTTEPITMLDNNSNDLLHGSKRSVILKEEYKSEFEEVIPEYIKLVQDWLKGCLGYEFVGERIGKQISKNDKMSEDPVTSVVSGVEAVMSLIEENNSLKCLNSEPLNNLSKDDIVSDLIGDICHNLEISSEERYNVSNECYKLYDNIEIVTI